MQKVTSNKQKVMGNEELVKSYSSLNLEENLFDFYVGSIAFRIKILINVTDNLNR